MQSNSNISNVTRESSGSDTCERCGWWKKICHCDGIPTNNIMFFTPYTYDDLDVYPIHITSKAQLKEETKKRGLVAARLL